MVGGGALFMAVITAGQTVGGVTRKAALLLPRSRTRGDGPNDFQVNRTASAAGITPQATGEQWRLTLTGGSEAGGVRPRGADGDATAHRPAADRLRRGMVDDGDVDRCAVARSRPVCRGALSGFGFRTSVERCGGFNRATLQALSVGLSGCIRLCLMVCDGSWLSMGNTVIWGLYLVIVGSPRRPSSNSSHYRAR